MPDVTGLLLSWRQGDAAALDRLVPLVYDELRRVARRHLQRELPGHALQATALVHEVYLRLVDVDRLTLKSRTHFFAVAAEVDAPDPRRSRPPTARRQARRRGHDDDSGRRVTRRSARQRGRACPRSSARGARLQSTPGRATLSNCDFSRGSTSTRRPKHWGCRPPQSSENGLWRKPGSFGGCRRNSDAGRYSGLKRGRTVSALSYLSSGSTARMQRFFQP